MPETPESVQGDHVGGADALCAACRPIPITFPQPSSPNRSEADRFLKLLDPSAIKFTFQTFDDCEQRKECRRETGEKDPYAKILHGTLGEHFDTLVRLNDQGAGIFICVNETDFRGRTAKNIVRVRSLFVDLDGAPIGPVMTARPAGHIIVESSPGKGHGYWTVTGVALGDFTAFQKELAARFNGDPSVHDLPRVMRLPGFFHRKAEPFMVRIIGVNDAEPLKASDFPKAEIDNYQEMVDEDAGKGIADDDSSPWNALNSTALANLSAWVPALFGSEAMFQPGTGAYRVSSKALKRKLQEDLSIHPDGIKDFGVHDQGDAREGKRSPIDVVMEHGNKSFAEAVGWLQDKLGLEAEAEPLLVEEGVTLDDFYAYMVMHNYIYIPTRDLWPGASVNARIPPIPILNEDGEVELDEHGREKKLKASAWLDQNRPVEQMTWAPGLPMLIRNRLVSTGGWIEKQGVSCFNLYRPPTIKLGDARKAGPWLDHVRKVYPSDADHIITWLAHCRQRPQDKINHSIVLGGKPGIGKDTLLEPAKQAVGPWNFHEISPKQVLGRFNGFLKSTIMRTSEARDLGDISRFEFYDAMKAYTAAPPDVLRIDEKNIREYYVANCVGVIITTNYKDALYLPPDDRRTHVAWSELTKEDFTEAYWKELWNWYYAGGFEHVAAYLATLDISGFNGKAPPLKTSAFWAIVDINRSPEDSELADRLDDMGNPKALTLKILIDAGRTSSNPGLSNWLTDRKNRRAIPHRLERCEYIPVRNPNAADGYWKIQGARQVVYAKVTLTPAEQFQAVDDLMRVLNDPNPPM
jgi:hypothetical protein